MNNCYFQLDANTVEIEERGVKLRLTVVDTPGFGDAIDNADSFQQIIKYIDQQFDRLVRLSSVFHGVVLMIMLLFRYLKDESGLNRKNIIDNRVHCCFYFISPYGHGLKPLDIDFMKQMSNKVNIVPVIAKSDCLTMAEIKKLKARIIEELAGAGIRIYQLPDVDQDEDEEYKLQVAQLRQSIPFAVCGANAMVEVAGKKVRGRQYPWGVVEVENPEHCDFVKLRSMLITHMQDLQEVTHDVHYENFRSEQLARGARGDSVSSAGSGAGPSSGGKPSSDAGKDKMLAEKDEELRRMQEMLAKMQEQIKQQSSTNLSAYNN